VGVPASNKTGTSILSAGPLYAEDAEHATSEGVAPPQINLFCPDGIFISEEEYGPLINILLRYVNPRRYELIGTAELPNPQAAYRMYGAACASFRVATAVTQYRMDRLIQMRVCPEDLVVEARLDAECLPDRAQLLQRLRESGHEWRRPTFAPRLPAHRPYLPVVPVCAPIIILW
jgi:hypothetical protein